MLLHLLVYMAFFCSSGLNKDGWTEASMRGFRASLQNSHLPFWASAVLQMI